MSGGARHHGARAGEWGPDRLRDLIVMWTQGRTSREIAGVLGVTRNAVMGKVHRLGLAARPSPIKRTAIGAPKPRVAAVKNSGPARPVRTSVRQSAPKPAPKGAGGVSSLSSVPVAVVPHDGTGILFGQAGTQRCAWPLWREDTPAAERRVCGCAVVRRADGSPGPYCAGHARAAFTRVPMRTAEAA